jgi:hypothetical protein
VVFRGRIIKGLEASATIIKIRTEKRRDSAFTPALRLTFNSAASDMPISRCMKEFIASKASSPALLVSSCQTEGSKSQERKSVRFLDHYLRAKNHLFETAMKSWMAESMASNASSPVLLVSSCEEGVHDFGAKR